MELKKLFLALASVALLATSSAKITQTYSGNPAALIQTRKQARTIKSFRSIKDTTFYAIDYKADYKLQEFIESDLFDRSMVTKAVARKLLGQGAPAAKAGPMKPGCSAFQAVTPDGDVIYGRNFDYNFKNSGTVMMRNKSKGAYKSLSMLSTSFIGMNGAMLSDGKTDLSNLVAAPYLQMDGMNEKGFAISVLQLSHKASMQFDKSKHTVMTSVMMRAVLDRAATVDEALEMISGWNFFADGYQKGWKQQSNYHFFMSDATGKSVLLEYVLKDGPGTESEWVMSPVDIKYATNHYRTEGWQKVGARNGRFEKLEAAFAANGGIMTEEEAMKLLDTVHQTRKSKTEGMTQWSVVYNLTKRTAKVCIECDFDKVYNFSL